MNSEDIESLGWFYDVDRDMYEYNNWILRLFNDGKISIIIRDPSKNNDSLIKNIMTSVNFLTVDNKQELKVLMKQLRIE